MNLNMADTTEAVEVSDAAFDRAFNEPLVHQVVVACLAGARQGSRAQKNRSDVRGGGRKPWRQKKTGRSRAGSIRSPLWRGGGVTFATRPQDFSQKINRKMYRGTMASIFSELLRHQSLVIVSQFTLATPKTKALQMQLKELQLDNVLIITNTPEHNLLLASRNLKHVSVASVGETDPVLLLTHEKVLITRDALKMLEARLT